MITWFECFVLTAAALVAAVWTYKRIFSKNGRNVNALHHKTPEKTLYLTSLSSHSKTNHGSEFSSCSETERCSTDNGQDETSYDASLGKSDKVSTFQMQEIVGDVKDVTVCSGYGSTGDNAQENTDKSEDSGVNNGDLNSDSWIADDSFGNTAITESRDVGSTEDEGHESEKEDKKKTYFTDRKRKLTTPEQSYDFERELQSSTDTDEIRDLYSLSSEPDGYKSKNDSVDSWANTGTTAEHVTGRSFDENSSVTTGTQSDSNSVGSTNVDTTPYRSESEKEDKKKTYFTDRKRKLTTPEQSYDFERELQSSTDTDEIRDFCSRSSEPDGYKSKNDSVDSWANTGTTAEHVTGRSFDENSSVTTGTQSDSNSVSSTNVDTSPYRSEGTGLRYCRHSECKPSSVSSSSSSFVSSIESLPSTIYQPDSSSSDDNVLFVEHHSDINLINSTGTDNLNEACIGE